MTTVRGTRSTSSGALTTPDGTHIAHRDHRPATEPPELSECVATFLLLHGLAGHQGEWDGVAARLAADGHRVVTYDARGHGASTRVPRTTTRAAHVQDAVTLIEELALAPVTLVGQSLGGHTAMLLAASHPHLVESLVLVEAGPGGPAPDLPAQIATWLDSWPTPFTSLEEAKAFLGHEAWTKTLEKREDGWRPAFDRTTIVATVAELATTAYWPEWTRITCPTLLVQGEHGTMRPDEPATMLTRRPTTSHTRIPDAGHDVHLDQPHRLHEAIRTFLA
ncbi:alpha/beta hydrolase [Streptomyces sp. Go-475]|uniref:alpha/beta fold hydrolase n=1 Tax=Streptomyces sp. Go-475 TaxID=2072505 RepID=UPI000DEF42EB|nr:alpha/beta hydrolase [Streptomyces sp. Go-475]AXE86207.1 Sigma factor SigB regulation protein RsbQ [Streptomyces sp. Go-475]